MVGMPTGPILLKSLELFDLDSAPIELIDALRDTDACRENQFDFHALTWLGTK
jgi:hypothetical protein